VSCLRRIRPGDSHLVCHFHSKSFPLGQSRSLACGTAYHRNCFRAGTPFSSRRKNKAGLSLPALHHWPCFVCELCTVRAVLDRELGHPGDLWLLQLERMRILDSLHNWSLGTSQQYQSRLRKLRNFESDHPGLHLLVPSDFHAPARGPEIGLMWAELHTSVQPLKHRGRSAKTTPVFTTIRQLRSAAGQYMGWNMITSQPSGTTFFQDRRLLTGNVRPTDSASYELFSRGLQARLGDESVPSTALLGRHVRGLNTYFDSHFRSASDRTTKLGYVLAGFANLLLWTSWLRGGEIFSLTWGDLAIVWPQEASAHDLPPGTGALLLTLLPETKSSRSANADVVVALRTATGLDLSLWLRRLLLFYSVAPTPSTHIFRTPTGKDWTSHTYRTNYLYPGLEYLRAAGDSFLQALGSDRGESIPVRFYSLHSYRRGGRSHCQRTQPEAGHTKATDRQVYEHGRWRRKRGSEPIAIQYQEWTLYERLRITLFSH